METNYFGYKYDSCDCGALKAEVVHIGKSSGGWRMLFNAMAFTSYNTLDMLKQLDRFDVIKDEHGTKILASEILDTAILKRLELPHTWAEYQMPDFDLTTKEFC